MTKTLFVLPEAERSALSSVWIATGNPAQPLACVWIDRDVRVADSYEEDRSQASSATSGQSKRVLKCSMYSTTRSSIPTARSTEILNDINFGQVQKAADRRVGQVTLKLNF
jgi:hypothetical protein